MNNLMNFVMSMINQSPQIANNPQAREFISVLQNGDSRQGSQIAENLCKTYGVSKEQAIMQAKQFFHIP